MPALLIEKTTLKKHAGLARPGNKIRHVEAHFTPVAPRKRRSVMRNLLISNLSLLALVAAIDQIMEYFAPPHYWSYEWFPINPVIEAWNPREEPTVPINWPDRNQQWKYPHTAILGPRGIEVVDRMHRQESLMGLDTLDGVPQATLT